MSEWRDIHARHSVLREVILEHHLTASLLQRLWQRRIFDAEILHSAFDAGGYDMVLTRGAVVRHIQLKASRVGASTRFQTVGLALARRPAGCVVWMEVDDDLSIRALRVFEPEPVAEFEKKYRTARLTRGDASGYKPERLEHRRVPLREFDLVPDLDGLLDRLLFPAANPDIA